MWVREAFGELYAGQAGQMAERMGRLRAKEVAKREAFLKHVERYMPAPLLSGESFIWTGPLCMPDSLCPFRSTGLTFQLLFR